MFELRDYQEQALDRLRAQYEAGLRRLLLVLPTGAGKTVVAAHVMHQYALRGERVLFLAHRRELIFQAAAKLEAYGLSSDAGGELSVALGGDARYAPNRPIQVASIQTALRRLDALRLDEVALVVIDEAHRARAGSYEQILGAVPPSAFVLGLTATPYRADRKRLKGLAFEDRVRGPEVADLIARGALVPPRVFASPRAPRLRDVGLRGGDYDTAKLAGVMNTTMLNGDIVTNWMKHAPERKTVVFAVNIEHSLAIAEEFRRAAVPVAHLDGSTPNGERAQILRELETGKLQVVCNVGVLTEGWDCPPVSCVVLARPTKSRGLWRQMVGRALRPAPGKVDCLVLDHAGSHYEHGSIVAPDVDEAEVEPPKQEQGEQGKSEGAAAEKMAIHNTDEELVEVGETAEPSAAQRSYLEWALEGKRLGYKPGWPKFMFKNVYGRWPTKEDMRLAGFRAEPEEKGDQGELFT